MPTESDGERSKVPEKGELRVVQSRLDRGWGI